MEGISHNINANGYKITADTEDVDDLYNCGKKGSTVIRSFLRELHCKFNRDYLCVFVPHK